MPRPTRARAGGSPRVLVTSANEYPGQKLADSAAVPVPTRA